jgi:phosphate transport system substrate-binding protein
LGLVVTALLVAGCESSSGSSAAATPSPVSGTATAAGSTALQPLVSAAKDEFEAKNPNASITVGVGGSFQGLSQVASKAVDIGDSDVPASAANPPLANASELVDHQVAVVPFVIIVSPNVQVTSLTRQQATDLISGKTTDWKAVGNPTSLPVAVFLRPKTSGTRYTFHKIVMPSTDETAAPAAIVSDTNTVIQNVAQAAQASKGGISYVGLGNVKATSGVTKLKYNNVDATPANVENGTYPIWSHEHMYTCTCDTGGGTVVAKAFINYMLSDTFQNGQAMTTLGFIPVKKVSGNSPADS